jgi:hypothetical protein
MFSHALCRCGTGMHAVAFPMYVSMCKCLQVLVKRSSGTGLVVYWTSSHDMGSSFCQNYMLGCAPGTTTVHNNGSS